MKPILADSGPVLVCDLDGTLVDSLPDLAEALSNLLRAAGRRALSDAEVRVMVGDGVAVLVERGFAATGGVPPAADLAAQVVSFIETYEKNMTARTRPFPGALEALAALRAAGWRLAVCTNKPEHATRGILSALGFDGLIEGVAGGDTYPVKKPDPDHILRLLKDMDAVPGHAAMLGDSANDVRAGQAAGLPVVVVSHGYGAIPAAELGAERVIKHFDELADALAALGFG
jgi:phosphoglycolate phosphatase